MPKAINLKENLNTKFDSVVDSSATNLLSAWRRVGVEIVEKCSCYRVKIGSYE